MFTNKTFVQHEAILVGGMYTGLGGGSIKGSTSASSSVARRLYADAKVEGSIHGDGGVFNSRILIF